MGDESMSLYLNTCLVQKVTEAQTSAGTVNPTYTTRISALECSIQNRNLQTTDSYAKETIVDVYKLYTPFNSTSEAIAKSDRIVWRGKSFEITGIGDGAGRRHHFEIDMLEVD
jgi:hypothetical protein